MSTTLKMSDFEATTIVYEADPLLVVHVNYHRPETPVTYEYDGHHGCTVYQSADMPRCDDQAVARKVSDWLEAQS